MPQNVLVTGASGFVGRFVVDELLARGHAVRTLVHRRPIAANERVQSVSADLFDPHALAKAMQGCHAVVHLVGIIQQNPSRGITFERMHAEATRSVVAGAKIAGVKRYVHMSALGTRAGAVSEYHQTKYRAEQCVQSSGLDWTIFRPSLIHGPGGEFTQMEAAWARKTKPPFLFMPYFGKGLLGFGGAGKLQPVYVKDVARAFAEALEAVRSAGEIYPLAVSQIVTWPQLHALFSQAAVGKRRWVLPLPVWAAKLQIALGIARLAGFNRDQVIMSQEDNTCDTAKFQDHFGWTPAGIDATLAQYGSQI